MNRAGSGPDHQDAPGGRLWRLADDRPVEGAPRRDGQPGRQGVGHAGDAADVHPGVVGEVGLEERGPQSGPRHLDEDRQVDERGRLDVPERGPGVFALVARVPAPQVQGEGRGVVGEVETRRLGGDREFLEGFLFGQDVAEGDALIVSPQDDVEPPPGRGLLAELGDELVELVGDHPLGPESALPGRGDRPLLDPEDLEVTAERGRAVKVEPERRIGQDRRSFISDAVIEPLAGEIGLGLGRDRQGDGQAAVRRRDAHRGARGAVLGRGAGPGQDEQGEQGGQAVSRSHGVPPFGWRGEHAPGFYFSWRGLDKRGPLRAGPDRPAAQTPPTPRRGCP